MSASLPCLHILIVMNVLSNQYSDRNFHYYVNLLTSLNQMFIEQKDEITSFLIDIVTLISVFLFSSCSIHSKLPIAEMAHNNSSFG